MKKILSTTLLAVLLLSCNSAMETVPQDICTKEKQQLNNHKGAALNLDEQIWYLKKNNINGIDVGVKLSGSIAGDSIKVRSYGDGVVYDVKLPLNKELKFNQTVGIFFTAGASKDEKITAKTLVMIFDNSDTLKVELASCPLQNLLYKSKNQ